MRAKMCNRVILKSIRIAIDLHHKINRIDLRCKMHNSWYKIFALLRTIDKAISNNMSAVSTFVALHLAFH